MPEFAVFDCTLLTMMSGLDPAVNLRELRERIAVCSADVLFHHFCETPMVPSFDRPDYRNDLALWAKMQLEDRVLAERLGILDPYQCDDLECFREQILEVLDDRLAEVPLVPTARPGSELYFMQAVTVVFDTGIRLTAPADLPAAIGRMSNGSIYYHFLEARRRLPQHCDDFSAWLADFGAEGDGMRAALGLVDYSFYSLSELRRELVSILSPEGKSHG